MRAAPSRTSFTSSPSVASAWLTRRTQAPQCIPSICKVNSAMIYPLWIDDSWRGRMQAASQVKEWPELEMNRGLAHGVEIKTQRNQRHAQGANPALLAEFGPIPR